MVFIARIKRYVHRLVNGTFYKQSVDNLVNMVFNTHMTSSKEQNLNQATQPDSYDIADAYQESVRTHGLYAVGRAKAHVLAGDKSPEAFEGFEQFKDALDYGEFDHSLIAICMRAARGDNVKQLAVDLLDSMTDHIGQHLADKADDAHQIACERLKGEL